MIKSNCSRPGNFALLTTVLLAAACGAYEDQSTDPETEIPPELAALRPELDTVIQRLQRLDHTGLAPVGEVEPPILAQTAGLPDRVFVAIADGAEEVPAVRSLSLIHI